MAQGRAILYINTYVECSLFKGDIWESQRFTLNCFPTKNPLAVVSTCVQKQISFESVFGGWYGKSQEELRKVLGLQKGQKPH